MGNREFDENPRRALLASAQRALEERVALVRKLYHMIDGGHGFCRNAGPKGRANSSGRRKQQRSERSRLSRECIMAQILQFIRPEKVFDSETTAVLAAAYERAISGLRARGQPEVMREIVAKRIIALAARGERDPERLYAAALAGLRSLQAGAALSANSAARTLGPPA